MRKERKTLKRKEKYERRGIQVTQKRKIINKCERRKRHNN